MWEHIDRGRDIRETRVDMTRLSSAMLAEGEKKEEGCSSQEVKNTKGTCNRNVWMIYRRASKGRAVQPLERSG